VSEGWGSAVRGGLSLSLSVASWKSAMSWPEWEDGGGGGGGGGGMKGGGGSDFVEVRGLKGGVGGGVNSSESEGLERGEKGGEGVGGGGGEDEGGGGEGMSGMCEWQAGNSREYPPHQS
jgi:hypothetical protein